MSRLATGLALLLAAVPARAHSWLDCVDYHCPNAAPNAGPQPPAACTCRGYARNWANVMAGTPFAADRGRDNRPGASPAAGGLVCDAGKEPNPGPGTTIPANMYSAEYPAATLAAGQNVRWRWPAKNHANTPQAGTVEVYIATAPNAGDAFTPGQPFAGQMSYSSDGGDCLGLAQSTDTADCQGSWTVPATLAAGRYTIMWWWEFNPGEFYNTCADVMITAPTQVEPPPGGGAPDNGDEPGTGQPGTGAPDAGDGGLVPMTRVSMTVDGTADTYTPSVLDDIALVFATTAGVARADVEVAVVSFTYGTDQYSSSSGSPYSTLAEALLLTADISHPNDDERLVAEAQLRSLMPTAEAATLAFAEAGVQVNVLDDPVIAAITGSSNGDDSSGGGNGAVVAIVIILLVVAVGAAGCFCFLKPNSAKATTTLHDVEIISATGGRPPPPPGKSLPPGWSEHTDPKSGRPYFVREDGETTWLRPGGYV